MTGTTIRNFAIKELIATGGMAAIYKAVQTSLDRIVAVKILHGHLAQDKDFIIRFEREAKAEAISTPPSQPPIQLQPKKPARQVMKPAGVSTTGALLRSCCLPGWGQLYKGQTSKGRNLVISACILLPTSLLFSIITEVNHQNYLDVPPGEIEKMDEAYRKYKNWYNLSGFL